MLARWFFRALMLNSNNMLSARLIWLLVDRNPTHPCCAVQNLNFLMSDFLGMVLGTQRNALKLFWREGGAPNQCKRSLRPTAQVQTQLVSNHAKRDFILHWFAECQVGDGSAGPPPFFVAFFFFFFFLFAVFICWGAVCFVFA